MFKLFDSFNNQVVSNHRSPTTAGKAARKFQKQVKKVNGQNSYIPLVLKTSNLDQVSDDDYNLFQEYYSGNSK